MIIAYNEKTEPIIKLNKNATDILVFECLECGGKMFIENGIDGIGCYKCNGMITLLLEKQGYLYPPINKVGIGCVDTMCLHSKHTQGFFT